MLEIDCLDDTTNSVCQPGGLEYGTVRLLSSVDATVNVIDEFKLPYKASDRWLHALAFGAHLWPLEVKRCIWPKANNKAIFKLAGHLSKIPRSA